MHLDMCRRRKPLSHTFVAGMSVQSIVSAAVSKVDYAKQGFEAGFVHWATLTGREHHVLSSDVIPSDRR